MAPKHLIIALAAMALGVSCQGRGRRNLALKPDPKQLAGGAKQAYMARFPVTFTGGTKAVTGLSLTNALCDGAEGFAVKSYDAGGEHDGSLTVGFFADPGLGALACTELGVRTDAKEIYTATFRQTAVPGADGVFAFSPVPLGFSEADPGGDETPGAGKDPGKNAPGEKEKEVKVDGEIKECPAGQKFDAKAGKCA